MTEHLTKRTHDMITDARGADEAQGLPIPVSPWPKLRPLVSSLPPVQGFDAKLLPEALRPYVMDSAERIQCPPDYIAVAIMVAASSVIGRKRTIRPKRHDNWRVTPNLWGAIVGRPGVMKSPAIKAGLAFLHHLAANARAKHEEALREHLIDLEVVDTLRKAAKRRADDAAKKGNHEAARDFLSDAPRIEDWASPALRRPIVNDTTVEALGEILIDNPYGTLAFRDELIGLLKGLDREGQEGARAFYLQGYDGDEGYTFDRIGRGKNLHIPAVCLSLLGGIQPSRLSAYVHDAIAGRAGDDGLMQRFGMMVYPDVSKKWRNVDRLPDNEAKEKGARAFEFLENLDPEFDTNGHVKSLRFDDGAQERFVGWQAELEHELRSDTLHPAMESHLAKYRKLIPALALVSALVDERDDVVTLTDLERAIAWGNYLRSHAERIYAASGNQVIENAKTIAGHIRRGNLQDGFTASEVRRRGWTGLSSTQDVQQALEALEEHGYLRGEKTGDGMSGRPTTRYQINPAVIVGGKDA